MKDFQISVSCVAAYVLWAASLIVWGIGWVTHIDDVGRLSLIICGAAVTAQIRSYIIDQHRRFRNMLAVTASVERDVTTLGTKR